MISPREQGAFQGLILASGIGFHLILDALVLGHGLQALFYPGKHRVKPYALALKQGIHICGNLLSQDFF